MVADVCCRWKFPPNSSSLLRDAYAQLPQNKCGGRVLSVEYMEKLAEAVHSRGLKLHCDGARGMNACATLGVEPSVLFRGCDSISLCLSKALGAPMGSVLIGTSVYAWRIQCTHYLSLTHTEREREREKMQHVTWRNAQTDMCETCFGINH